MLIKKYLYIAVVCVLLAGALDKFADKSLDYKRNAYTFGGNHDKPRMAECYGLDMGLFHSNLDNHSTPEEINHRKTAYMLMAANRDAVM